MPITDDLGNVFPDEGDVALVGPHGEVLLTNDPSADGSGAFGGPVDDLFHYGVLNGSLAHGPPVPQALLSAENPLPYWDAPKYEGTNGTAQHGFYALSPSRAAVQMSMGGAINDRAYLEQIVPIGGDAFRSLAHVVRLTATSNLYAVPYISMQYLDKGLLTIPGSGESSGVGVSGQVSIAEASSRSGVPALAAYLRIRAGMRLVGTASPGSIALISVRLEAGRVRWLTPDSSNPTNHAAGVMLQRNGHLLLGGDSLLNGIAVPQVSSPTNPPSGYHAIYAKPDGRLYGRNASGTEHPLTGDGALIRSGVISPAALSAATDDWNPTGLATCSIIRASSDAARDLSGIAAQEDGRLIRIYNVGSFDISLLHDSTSTAANRFLCPDSAAYVLNPNDSAEIWYDGTSDRWRVMGRA